MIENKNIRRFVISGSPCSGKTTIINELAQRGFFTTPGIGRIAKRYNYCQNFNSLIELAFDLESLIPKGIDIVFSCGGLPDSIAYLKAYGKQATNEHYEFCRRIKYDKVFILSMIPNYFQDEFRDQSYELAMNIGKECENVYSYLGYETIYIPFMSIDDRVDRILSCIKANYMNL